MRAIFYRAHYFPTAAILKGDKYGKNYTSCMILCNDHLTSHTHPVHGLIVSFKSYNLTGKQHQKYLGIIKPKMLYNTE